MGFHEKSIPVVPTSMSLKLQFEEIDKQQDTGQHTVRASST